MHPGICNAEPQLSRFNLPAGTVPLCTSVFFDND